MPSTPLSDEPYVAYDYTALQQRPKLIYRLVFRWKYGLDLIGAAVAGAVWVALVVVGLLITIVLPLMSRLVFGGWLIGASVITWGVYRLYVAQTDRDLSLWEQIYIWWDWIFHQPRQIGGFAHDTEPGELHWQVILWRPTGRRWHARLAAARELERRGR